MSDSAQIMFVQEIGEAPIYLYRHSRGYAMASDLANALKEATPRWDQPSYATRIITREIFYGFDGDTGGGLSTVPYATDHPTFVVDFTDATVHEESPYDFPTERVSFLVFSQREHPDRGSGLF